MVDGRRSRSGEVLGAEKRKGNVEKPQKTPRPAKPDHIPAHVRRAV
jgi:hypothetical protein